jgi:hypothetical protein
LGFAQVLAQMATETELARGVTSAGLMALLSAPMGWIGYALRAVPDRILAEDAVAPVLGFLGLVSGVALGHYSPLPMDLSMVVGMGAGLGGKHAQNLQERMTKKKGNGDA